MDLLDIGCGPGTIALDLAEAVAPGTVTAVENTEVPLATARAAAVERGDRTTRFELADAHELPFEESSFDVVHAHQVLQHLADPVTALKEMARVCKPEGWIAVRDADYAAMSWYPEIPELEEWRAIYRAVARRNGGAPDAARRMRHWARAAGMADARYTASVWNYADGDTCRWWANSQAERYCAPWFAAQAAQHGVSEADLQRIATGWRAWGEHPDAWFAILHGELLVRA